MNTVGLLSYVFSMQFYFTILSSLLLLLCLLIVVTDIDREDALKVLAAYILWPITGTLLCVLTVAYLIFTGLKGVRHALITKG